MKITAKEAISKFCRCFDNSCYHHQWIANCFENRSYRNVCKM